MDMYFINWGLIIVVACVIVAGFTFSAVAARRTQVGTTEPRGQRVTRRFGPGGALAVLAVLVIGGTLVSYRAVETDSLQHERFNAQLRTERVRIHEALDALTDASTEADRLAAVTNGNDSVSEDSEPRALPGWTQTPLTVLESGSDEAILVAQSELCATPKEALNEATARAIAALQDRLAKESPALGSWTLPVQIFQRSSIEREPFIEVQRHEFGGIQEPMFRAFIQYKDTAAVRRQFLDNWQGEVAEVRAAKYAVSLAGVGIGLGVISTLLRSLLAISGRQKKASLA
jgi:hypothetical protein